MQKNIIQLFGGLRNNDREVANVVTHGLGLVLTLIAMPFLIYRAFYQESSVLLMGVCVFALSMFLVYLSSTLYHGIQEPKTKHRFRIMDHICIYYLIAGTYTPFMLTFLQNSAGNSVLFVVWLCAFFGTIFKLVAVDRFEFLSTMFYVAMGWTAIIYIEQVISSFPTVCLSWILAGALFYTLGVVFYLWKRYKYHHAVWHLFVMAGGACHYVAVYNSVLLAA